MLYICCHIIRGLAIWQMHPVLKNTGYGCTFEDSVVMVYGDLQGAIGLALALIVETEEAFPKLDRDRVLFHVCGIVTLTLIINAPTVKYVVKYLGLNKPPSATEKLIAFYCMVSKCIAQYKKENLEKAHKNNLITNNSSLNQSGIINTK